MGLSFLKLREQICDVCHKMWQAGCDASDDGSISVKLPDGTFMMTPAGISKSLVTPEKLIRVNKKGVLIEGEESRFFLPEMKVHFRCYKARTDVRSVIRANPPSAMGFAAAKRPLLWYPVTEGAFLEEVEENATRLIKENRVVLFRNYGVLATGTDVSAAYDALEALERAAKAEFTAYMLSLSAEHGAEPGQNTADGADAKTPVQETALPVSEDMSVKRAASSENRQTPEEHIVSEQCAQSVHSNSEENSNGKGKQDRGVGLQPLDEIDGYQVRPGFYNRDGATATTRGVSFTIHSFGATGCSVLLFHPQEKEPYAVLKYPESYHIGNTFAMFVFGLKIEEFEYAFRLEGPYDAEKGLLFSDQHVLLDPYARAVTGQRNWGEQEEENFVYHARVVENNFDWGDIRQVEHPAEDLIIYEMHVRGFTKDESSGVKAKGTYEGLREKIPYLRDLGINAVELMPIFEFDEMESTRIVDGERLYNYWGYNTVCFFAPNTSYTYAVEHNHEGDELKQLIYELKQNKIEVILDVVFNHTAEGNEDGPCFSFKGIDNNIYYILTPDGHYYNFSGCGNVMNCNHPSVRRFIIDCLRYWVTEYRVDGFRFDLASILTRDEKGAPMADPPLLQEIACDAILGKVKLIAEAWDAGGLYQVGSFPSWSRWSEWNGRYRDDMRRFLKGDEGMAGTAITRITGSKDLYDPDSRGSSASVNFITCHDGFTLYDLYSYNMKHNEKNGWDNTDGDNNGNSWNCGVEGDTDDEKVETLRRRMVKNAFATLMCSRGPAMFYAGDEFCNTQFGNNNAYCQDNITSWLDWTRLDTYREIYDFFRYMIQFRKRHPILRKTTKTAACGLPEISIHNGFPWNGGTDHTTRLIGIMYAGRNQEDTKDDIVFYGMNAYWEPLVMQLPELSEELQWKICVNTSTGYGDEQATENGTEFYAKSTVSVPPRTVMILEAVEK